MLKLIYLNRLLHIAHEEINRTRLEKKFNIHLKEFLLVSFNLIMQSALLIINWELSIYV